MADLAGSYSAGDCNKGIHRKRNRFLQLATRYVNGEDVRVMCDGIEYHPLWYILKPIKGGGWSHTAHMKDTIAVESHREAPLEDLTEVRG